MPESRLEVWGRRQGPVLAVIPYLLLVATVVVDLVAFSKPAPVLAGDLVLAGLAGGWMLWMVTLHPAWVARRRLMGGYFVVLLALLATLVLRDPLFGYFAFSGYLQAGTVLHGRWQMAGVVANAVVEATAQDGGLPDDLPGVGVYAAIIVVNAVLAGLFTWFAGVDEERLARRKRDVAALTEANQKLAESLRENAGLHAQLLTQAREAGIADERARMARELHDTLAQGLAGIITQIQAAEQSGHNPTEARRHLRAAIQLARDSLSEARRSVRALQPEALVVARLPEAITEVTRRWSTLSGVPAQVTVTGVARPMRPEIEVTLLRTAQEALANVAKHASASRVGLTLSYMEDVVTLDVRDDGVGFTPAERVAPAEQVAPGAPVDPGPPAEQVTAAERVTSAERGALAAPADPGAGGSNGSAVGGGASGGGPEGGFGLTAMRQRVHGLAGSLEIESEPGSGTAISASLPAVPAGSDA